ncbi:MAG: tyrosine-type recombinase/integrase, partial [Pseudonocardiaceae bacterium]
RLHRRAAPCLGHQSNGLHRPRHLDTATHLGAPPRFRTRDLIRSLPEWRGITPPTWVLDLLKRRHVDSLCAWIFPSTTLTLRDPDNTRARLRDVVRGTPWEGLHPHAFRHLVATQLDRAGLSAREIADYLGHERVSMTQDVDLRSIGR